MFEQHDCHFIIFISHFFTCYPLKKNQHFPQPIYLSLYSVSKQSLTLVPLFLIPFFPSSSAALPEDRAGAARQNSQHVRMFPYSSSAAAAALLNLSALALHHLPFTPPYMLSLRILHSILFVTFSFLVSSNFVNFPFTSFLPSFLPSIMLHFTLSLHSLPLQAFLWPYPSPLSSRTLLNIPRGHLFLFLSQIFISFPFYFYHYQYGLSAFFFPFILMVLFYFYAPCDSHHLFIAFFNTFC